jgi:hypothetical protein
MVEYDFSSILLAVLFFTVVVYLVTHILANLTPAKVGVTAVVMNSMVASQEDDEANEIDTVYHDAGVANHVSGGTSNVTENVSGGGEISIVPVSERYDFYEDVTLLDGIDRDFSKSIKNVVVDGNNLLYYLKDLDKKSTGSYMKHLEHAIKVASGLFKKKAIFFVMKDPANDTQRNAALSDMGYETNVDYKQAFREYSEKILKKHPSVRIVIAYGDAKARDDYACIYLAELLDNAALLTRDRYRDVQNTAGAEDLQFKVYGKAHKKFEKLMSRQAMPVIGNWSFRNKLVGYAAVENKSHAGLYKLKKENMHVLLEKF